MFRRAAVDQCASVAGSPESSAALMSTSVFTRTRVTTEEPASTHPEHSPASAPATPLVSTAMIRLICPCCQESLLCHWRKLWGSSAVSLSLFSLWLCLWSVESLEPREVPTPGMMRETWLFPMILTRTPWWWRLRMVEWTVIILIKMFLFWVIIPGKHSSLIGSFNTILCSDWLI